MYQYFIPIIIIKRLFLKAFLGLQQNQVKNPEHSHMSPLSPQFPYY